MGKVKYFGAPLIDFELTVPTDYNHDTQIDTFAAKTKKLLTTHYFNKNLTSSNFAKATNKLEPGKKYRVRIFPILSTVSSVDCVIFLKKQGAILVGGQGVTLLQDQKADEFPVGKWTVSFDEKDALWESAAGHHMVSHVDQYSGGGWGFNLGCFKGDWCDINCLLCVTEV